MNEVKNEASERSEAERLQRVVMLQAVQSLRDATKVQCNDGNWNYDSYMHGMANGMIFALSLFQAGRPEYLEAPDEWGEDKPDLSQPIMECAAT